MNPEGEEIHWGVRERETVFLYGGFVLNGMLSVL